MATLPNIHTMLYLFNPTSVLDLYNKVRGVRNMQIQKSADLARIIKTQRQSQGLTQQDVADAVGVTRQSLARIERGHGGTSFDTVLRIFERLNIRLEAHVENNHNVTSATTSPDAESSLEVVSAAFQRVRDLNLSPLAAAASAASRNIDTSAMLQNLRSALNHFAKHAKDTSAKHESKFRFQVEQQAAVNAAIEAGDPDQITSAHSSDDYSQVGPNGVSDG